MSNQNYVMLFTSTFAALDEVQAKKTFLQLAHKYHPDRGGNTLIMQYLNCTYKDYLKGIRTGESKESQDQIDADLIEKVNLIIKYSDLEIEILGSWIWVTGNTKDHKENLKSYGFLFSPKKVAWYYRKEDERKSRSKGGFTLEEIRERHGSKFANKTVKLTTSAN
jgi:hypothetical protein